MLETKSIAALAFNFNDNETPRKRKRETRTTNPTTTTTKVTVADPPLAEGKCRGQETGAAANASCFTNAAFSSTPKKIIGRRRLAKENNHGNSNCHPNTNPFPCLEFKSIADLAQEQPTHSTNPFEVVRQPSKKKKREHACFENPGLNLELPEKQFNPYEVVRCAAMPAKGFVNPALNLRGNDTPASLNPFEIHRPSETTALAAHRPPTGVENPALADDVVPTNLKIGLPFAPTLGCRIDFHGMALSQLTPSKLLAEKLVFSPVQPAAAAPAPKRSLGAISEENSTMDIGKELDRYQLELENSINEAKLRKNGISVESIEYKEQQITLQDEVNGERRSFRCATRRRTLTEINETPETEETEEVSAPTVVQIDEPREDEEELKALEQLESGDVAYASESDEDDEEVAEDLKDNLDFKAPMRFVRSYRPAGVIRPEKLKAESKDSLTSIASSKSSKSTTEEKETNQQHQQHGHGVKNMIRKSIRRLIHPLSSNQETGSCPAPPPTAPTAAANIMSSIRHSLRRRPQHQKLNASPEKQSIADISIVDTSERTMKLRSIIPQTEYMTIEQLTNEKKHTLRNSIRRSTRDVLRHVFHKSHDAYDTAK